MCSTLAPRPSEAGVAGPATVDAADPSTHTVDLRLVAPTTITGRQVESHTGKPAVGVRARLAALSPEGRRVATLHYDVDNSQPKDDATGEFTLRGVPPGPQLLELDGWTVHDRTMENGNALPITVLAGQTLDVGTVEVSYVPHFSGTFSGLPGKQQEGMVGDMEVRCALRPAGGGEWKQAFVDLWQGQGRYTVWAKDLPEGKYDAVLIASEGEQPRHVTSLVKGVELREDGKSKTVPIAFTRGASISGKMLQADGKPLAVSVTARPISGEAVALAAPALLRWMGSLHVHVKADQQGRFRITGLPPGEYEIIAHVSEGYYGPKPKQKVRVTRDQQKTGVVLRTTKAW